MFGSNPTELSLEDVIMNYVHCMAHQDMDRNGLCYKLQQKAYGSADQLINICVNTPPCLVTRYWCSGLSSRRKRLGFSVLVKAVYCKDIKKGLNFFFFFL